MEEARQGRDVATLEVVREAARPLTHSQLEGLGGRTEQAQPQVTMSICQPMAMAV